MNMSADQLREAVDKNRCIGSSRVYLVGEDVVAKYHASERAAKNEYDIGRLLFDNMVSVPEMYDLVSFCINPYIKLPNWYILMQRIKGKPIRELHDSKRHEAVTQYRAELKKALSLNICPDDIRYGNTVFDTDQEKLYLIDFEFWRKLDGRSAAYWLAQKFRIRYLQID